MIHNSDAKSRHVYGYARISTAAGDFTAQRTQLDAAGCEKVYFEKITGIHADRPQLRKRAAGLRLGDVVISPAADHIPQDTTDLIVTGRQMREAGVGPRFLALPSSSNAPGLSSAPCTAGRGKGADHEFGRKPKLTLHQQREAAARVAAGEPQRAVARSLNVSKAIIFRLRSSLPTPPDYVRHHA